MDHLGLFATLIVLAPIMFWIGLDRQAPKRARKVVRKPILSNESSAPIETDTTPAFS